MRAVCYCRVSSQVQRDRETIASQIRTLPAFVESRGWTLVRPATTYVDDGRTAKAGHLDERDGFRRLIQDAAAHAFDVVAVVAMDRLTRAEDMLEKAMVLGPLQRAGVQIAEASTGQVHRLDSTLGEFVAYIATFAAARENEERRDRTIRGRIESARRGRKPAGPTLFGYVFDRAAGWGIDEDAAAIVRELYRRTAAGESCYRLALDLESRGIPRPRAGTWQRDRVWQIVRNPAYRGEYLADKARGLVVAVPPLVTPDEWEATQTALARRRTVTTHSPRYSLLEGIARCGICGSKVYISGNRNHARYYICGRRLRPDDDGRCTLPYWRVEALDARVWAAVEDAVRRPDLLEMASSRRRRPTRDWRRELAACEQRLARMARAEAQILERFARGQVTAAALDRYLATAASERETLERDRDLARQHVEDERRSAADLAAMRDAAEELRERLDRATPQDRQALVRLFVPGRDGYQITVTREGADVRGIWRTSEAGCSAGRPQDRAFRLRA